jgi:L1 cell adhesion molecule like protein
VPQIEITYDIDANGILNVSAVEKSTGKTNKITITNDRGRLSADEVERLVKEAEKYEAEDKAKAERVTARNEMESYMYNARNTLREDKVKEQLGAYNVQRAEKEIDAGIKWLEENQDATTEEIKAEMKGLEERVRPILMSLYNGPKNGEESEAAYQEREAEADGKGPRVEEVD